MVEQVKVSELEEYDVIRVISVKADKNGNLLLKDNRPVTSARDVQVWSLKDNDDGTVDMKVLVSANLRSRGSDIKTHTFTKNPEDTVARVTNVYKGVIEGRR